jgi:hypothetical protein
MGKERKATVASRVIREWPLGSAYVGDRPVTRFPELALPYSESALPRYL